MFFFCMLKNVAKDQLQFFPVLQFYNTIEFLLQKILGGENLTEPNILILQNPGESKVTSTKF